MPPVPAPTTSIRSEPPALPPPAAPASNTLPYRFSTTGARPEAWRLTLPEPLVSGKRIIWPFEHARRWPDDGLLIGINTNYMPAPPPPRPVPTYICKDGLWGLREYTLEPQFFDHRSPHLAFLAVPTSYDKLRGFLFRPPSVGDWQRSERTKRLILSDAASDNIDYTLGEIFGDARTAREVVLGSLGSNPAGFGDSRLKLFTNGLFPSLAIATAKDAFKLLNSDGVSSEAAFEMVWHAMYRALRELVAYVHFCACLLPSEEHRDILQPRLLLLTGYRRRGCLLTGSDVGTYYDLFANHLVPVYAVLFLGEFTIAEDDLRLHNRSKDGTEEPRQSIEVDVALSKFMFVCFA
jgi:hypothetical protein